MPLGHNDETCAETVRESVTASFGTARVTAVFREERLLLAWSVLLICSLCNT